MIINTDITIYNRIYDFATRLDTWKRTIIEGVSFFRDVKTNLGENGLTTADLYKIRIPEENCRGYVPPKDFTGADNTWTIQNDDYIVQGKSTVEIIRPKELIGGIRINSWSDNRRGSVPHIRIGGQ